MLVRLAGWWAARRIWGSINNIGTKSVDLGSSETKVLQKLHKLLGVKKKKLFLYAKILQRYSEVFQLLRKFKKGLSMSWQIHLWEGVSRRDI